MSIRFLYIVFVVSVVLLLGNCVTKRFITNDNSIYCGLSDSILEEHYSFDILAYKNKVKETGNRVYEKKLSKNTTLVFSKYYSGGYYMSYVSKKYPKEIIYNYDSLGRLIFKYSSIAGVKIGEKIKFSYKDTKSREPIEVYRVNYDLMYPICWKEALAIGKRKGINIKKVEISIIMPDEIEDRKYPMAWTLYDKRYIMDVDAYTGKVTRFNKREGIIYEE